MRVLLGVTGSVATVLVKKLVEELQAAKHEVQIVATKSSQYFFDQKTMKVRVWRDEDEWSDTTSRESQQTIGYQKGQPIPHIELRKWADVLVVAPLSANTLAKFANGLCDNLLTCIFRAWDFTKPVILAPAMNTYMWTQQITKNQLFSLTIIQPPDGFEFLVEIIEPQSKMLACGDEGIGAMADISTIVEAVNKLDKTQPKDDQPPADKAADVAKLASK